MTVRKIRIKCLKKQKIPVVSHAPRGRWIETKKAVGKPPYQAVLHAGA